LQKYFPVSVSKIEIYKIILRKNEKQRKKDSTDAV